VKPAAFDYVAARSVAEALDELAADPEETKVIAGGQSLMPMLAFRLARPGRLLDINAIPELSGVTSSGRTLTVGATTRHRALERTDLDSPLGHLFRAAGSQIGHLPIRTRGTFGGSVAHSDAASEWCLVAALLDARVTVTSAQRGTRTIMAADFFESLFTTSMEADELLLNVELPALESTWATGLVEVARRSGDFGIVTVATAVRMVDGVVQDAKVAIGGVADIPFRSTAAESVLIGSTWESGTVFLAAEAAADEVDPPSDSHGSAAYRRGLVRALVPRSLTQTLATS
jgi:carbon-monoxide dehydrogenase medium subunit